MSGSSWDQSLKFLARKNQQSFVSFFLQGAQFLGECDKEFQARTIHADLVYEVEWNNEKIILHAEFQRKRDKAMARRVWEYNVLAECATNLPVYSVVLYLVKDGHAIEPPYERRLRSGEVIHHFNFHNIKLWEIDASMLRQPGLEGLLPLLTLTQDGARPEVVDEMISDLVRVEKQDLLPIAYFLAALVFQTGDEDTSWLKERFKPLLNLFEDSWAYQEMVAEKLQEGLKEGRQEGLQALGETFVRYMQKNFPTLVALTKQQTSLLTDIDRLRDAFDVVMDATTATEVEAILMHLSDETQSTQ